AVHAGEVADVGVGLRVLGHGVLPDAAGDGAHVHGDAALVVGQLLGRVHPAGHGPDGVLPLGVRIPGVGGLALPHHGHVPGPLSPGDDGVLRSAGVRDR